MFGMKITCESEEQGYITGIDGRYKKWIEDELQGHEITHQTIGGGQVRVFARNVIQN